LRLSNLFKDQPMKPVDTAVYWTEYILRHDDLSHLKPVGREQTWFQRRLLDVWLFTLLCTIVLAAFCFKIVVFVVKSVSALMDKAESIAPKSKVA
jgi:glucuronosyltransferase